MEHLLTLLRQRLAVARAYNLDLGVRRRQEVPERATGTNVQHITMPYELPHGCVGQVASVQHYVRQWSAVAQPCSSAQSEMGRPCLPRPPAKAALLCASLPCALHGR